MQVPPCEQQPVAGQVVTPQGTLLPGRRALLVEYRATGVVGYFPALFTDTHRPVEFFVVEEIDVGHRPGFSGYFAPYHHRRAMGVGRVARRVERPVIGHPEADERIAQRNVRQRRIPGELDMPRGCEKPDLRAYGTDRGVVRQGFAEVMQRIVFDLGVVVEQQQVIACRGCEPQVVASGEPQVALAAQCLDPRVAFAQHGRLVAGGTVVHHDDLQRRGDVPPQRFDHGAGEPVAIVIDRYDRNQRFHAIRNFPLRAAVVRTSPCPVSPCAPVHGRNAVRGR